MRWNIAFVLVMLACPAAYADVYEWIDGQGVVHFTDNPDKVPAKFRKNARIKTNVPAAGSGALAEKERAPVAVDSPAEAKERRYGDRDEHWWRSRFNNVQREIKGKGDELAAKKESLTELHRKRVIFQKPSNRVAYNALAEEISGYEETLKTLQDQLAALQAEADQLGVPQEWRQ